MELDLPKDVIEHTFRELRKKGRVDATFSVPLSFNDLVGCRSCNWIGDMGDCEVGKYTKNSLSCPECGAFCGEFCSIE